MEKPIDRLSYAHALKAAGFIGAYVWDLHEDRIYSDPTLASLFDLTEREACGGISSAEFLSAIYPDDRDRLSETIAAASFGAHEFIEEYRIEHSDGGIRWVWTHARCHQMKEDRPQVYVGVAVDITALRQPDTSLDLEALSDLCIKAHALAEKHGREFIGYLLSMTLQEIGYALAKHPPHPGEAIH